MSNKTHYRKVFKSDHLGVADLEDLQETGNKLIFNINIVKQETNVMVAGIKGNHNIAYFNEKINPLVLNATNSKIVKSFNNNSPFVEDWEDTPVQLYIDHSVKMKGEVVGGVRISPVKPVTKKPELTPKHPRWSEAKQAVKDGRKDGVLLRYYVSEINLKELGV